MGVRGAWLGWRASEQGVGDGGVTHNALTFLKCGVGWDWASGWGQEGSGDDVLAPEVLHEPLTVSHDGLVENLFLRDPALHDGPD